MSTFQQHRSMEHEASNAGLLPVKKFSCSLCGFKFSKKKLMINHYNFCKDVENPADRLGANLTTLQNKSSEEEIHSSKLLYEYAATEPIGSYRCRLPRCDQCGPFNHSSITFAVKKGDRIAQLICERVLYPEIVEITEVDETARGKGGFGSTGVN